MGLGFTKPIDKFRWDNIRNDIEVIELLQRGLTKQNKDLTIETTLKDLMQIYKVKEGFERVLNERLKHAPNRQTAKDELKKELLDTLNPTNNTLSEIRNIGYSNAIKGIPLQLIDLGYLFLNQVFKNTNDEVEFLGYNYKPLLEFVLEPLAEGVGIAFYLNNNNDFKFQINLKDEQLKPLDKKENILELTEANLIKCGFYHLSIKDLLTRNNCFELTTNKLGAFFASNIENKIYTGTEAFRRAYFRPDTEPKFPLLALGLIPEYYELAESHYLQNSKKRLTLIYNEQTEKQKFREREINKAMRVFKESEGKAGFNFNSNRFLAWNDYLDWLNKPNQSKHIDKSHATKLTFPIIRRFCELCNNSGLDKKDPNEDVIPYCQRICLKFGLEYSDNVRQYFDPHNEPKPTDKHLKKVVELILPKLKASDRAIIDNYIKPK